MTIEKHNGVHVLRDDLLPGGTKSTFLPYLMDMTKEYFVYASPVYGGMQIALAHCCKAIGKQAVIFCAKRKKPHANSLLAKDAGALVYQIPYGYLTHCQQKAREFTAKHSAQLIEFGADYPQAVDAIAARMRLVSSQLGREPDEIFCAVGSGTLLKGIIKGTDTAKITGVQVGAAVDNPKPDRVTILKHHQPFEKIARIEAPFPSCGNYDRKAWEYCLKHKKKESVLFWNVL